MTLHDPIETIAAQATAVGEGAIGIIRLSGPAAKEILGKIFRPRSSINSFESHRLTLGQVIHPQTGEIYDQVMVVWMEPPRTFTGEEMAEIHAHGGPFILCRILDLVIECGARMAEPGEFSKRAYLNGKMDLSQAEAVADLIYAKNERAVKNSLMQLDGYLFKTISDLKERLIHLLSLLEAGFDFAEGDIQLFDRKKGAELLRTIRKKIGGLVDSFQTGRLYREGIQVALVGRPNVGKSSLLNAILREERAIIHEAPGTTRDVISGERKINGMMTTFHDTAGIRKSEDPVEVEGIRRSERILESSDIVCVLWDSSQEFNSEDKNLLDRSVDTALVVVTKIDLKPVWEAGHGITKGRPTIRVSSLRSWGIDELLSKIYELAIGDRMNDQEHYVINNVRHKQSLKKASSSLEEIIGEVERGNLTEECLVEEIRMVVSYLSEITGEVSSEDVLSEIFSRFCIGK